MCLSVGALELQRDKLDLSALEQHEGILLRLGALCLWNPRTKNFVKAL